MDRFEPIKNFKVRDEIKIILEHLIVQGLESPEYRFKTSYKEIMNLGLIQVPVPLKSFTRLINRIMRYSIRHRGFEYSIFKYAQYSNGSLNGKLNSNTIKFLTEPSEYKSTIKAPCREISKLNDDYLSITYTTIPRKF